MISVDEEELRIRIIKDLERYQPSDVLAGAAWAGYLAACIEWDLITPAGHARLLALLPPLSPDPSVGILLGHDE